MVSDMSRAEGVVLRDLRLERFPAVWAVCRLGSVGSEATAAELSLTAPKLRLFRLISFV